MVVNRGFEGAPSCCGNREERSFELGGAGCLAGELIKSFRSLFVGDMETSIFACLDEDLTGVGAIITDG